MAAKYMSPEQMAQQTGISLPIMRKVFEAAETKRYPRLFIKTKGQYRGRLCIQGNATYDAVISVANKMAKTMGEASPQRGATPVIVPVEEFVEACVTAISSGRGLTRRHSTTKQYQNLMCWSVDAEAAGVVAPIRLDIACALAKRMNRLPEDAYGDEIRGAMLVPSANHEKWVVTYDTSSPITVNSPDSGNIDHVIPRSAGVVAPIRLDIACALAKRMNRLPEDAYGDEIRGAMLVPAANHEKWVVVYDTSAPITVNSPDSGNIDHVIPRSAGGSSCLCNLQVMRVRSNIEKSSDMLPDVSGEPRESLRVLGMLRRGARMAAARGQLDDATSDAFERLLREETAECLAMLKTREVMAIIAQKGTRRAGRCLGNAIRDAAGAVARVPRRLAIRYATRLISES